MITCGWNWLNRNNVPMNCFGKCEVELRRGVKGEEKTLTPALSHPMGEGDQTTILNVRRPRLQFSRQYSPSPIGWERAGVRVQLSPE